MINAAYIAVCSYSAGYKAILILQICIEPMSASTRVRGFIHALKVTAWQQMWARLGLFINGFDLSYIQAYYVILILLQFSSNGCAQHLYPKLPHAAASIL